MLRRAVVQAIAAGVPELGGRVYQAFLAPPDAQFPYATVRLAGELQQTPLAGAVTVDVRLYERRGSFLALDALQAAVMAALHRREVVDPETGARYELAWAGGAIDLEESERDAIVRLLRFSAAVVFAR